MKDAISEWLSSESKMFTILTGEKFSHYEVAMAVVYVAGLFLCLGIAGLLN